MLEVGEAAVIAARLRKETERERVPVGSADRTQSGTCGFGTAPSSHLCPAPPRLAFPFSERGDKCLAQAGEREHRAWHTVSAGPGKAVTVEFGTESQGKVTPRTPLIAQVQVNRWAAGRMRRAAAGSGAGAVFAAEVAAGKPARSVPPDSNMAAPFVCLEVPSPACSRS